jgi:hypothetical protein
MSDDLTTKPTMETVLEMLRAVRDEMRAGFVGMREEVRKGFSHLDVRLDRIESDVQLTQSKFHALRADFNEFKAAVREHFPTVQ